MAMDAPEPVEKFLTNEEAEALSKSQHVKIVGEGVNLEELRKEDGKGTEFEIQYDEVPEVQDKNYFDGEELFRNLNLDVLDQDSDAEDDGLTSFERLAREMDDVTGDRGVIRKVQKTGTGTVVTVGSNVVVHFNCYLEDIQEPYDSTRLRNKPERFVLGRGDVIPFLDIAVSTMRKGEISRFLVKPQYAYGDMGVPPRIPGNALILAQIELISFSEHAIEEENHTWSDKKKGEATFKKILKEVIAHRQAGNDFYNQGLLHKAKHKYQKAERLLEDARLKDEDEEDEMKRVMLKIYLNLALCYLKIRESTRALTYSKKALQLDATSTKGLFRCGQAYYQCSDFHQARKHMLQAQRRCPNDPSIAKELAKLELSYKKFKALENNMYTNMFPGWRDVDGAKVSNTDAQKKKQAGPCSDEFKRQTTETIENFRDNPDLQVMPFAVDIRTNEEIAFIQSAAIDMGLEVKAFSQTGDQDKYVKIIKPVVAEET